MMWSSVAAKRTPRVIKILSGITQVCAAYLNLSYEAVDGASSMSTFVVQKRSLLLLGRKSFNFMASEWA